MALDSAMPRLKARSGNFFANAPVIVDFERSASSVTIFGSVAASSTIASPKAARLAFAGIRDLLRFERLELVDDRACPRVGREVRIPPIGWHTEDLADR